MEQQPEPVTVSGRRDGLMAQVEESTAGLCKEIPHLTVQRQRQTAYSDEEGARKGKSFAVSLRADPYWPELAKLPHTCGG